MDEPRLPARKRPNNVVVDLKGLKSRWLQWCQSVDMPPSQAMRVLVRRLENARWPRGAGEAPPTTEPEQRRSKSLSVRPRVPLTREDKQDRPYGPRGITTLVALRLVHVIGFARLGVDVGFRPAPNAGRGRGYG